MLSIIICTYNRAQYIYECLQRLSCNPEGDWEIVLVNNNSTDQTETECKRFEQDCQPTNYRYIVETQQGLSYARNRGIQEAKGDWLVFIDDDSMVEPNYVATLQNYLSAYPQAGAFGGPITPRFEEQTPDWLSPWSMSFVSAIDKGQHVCLFEGSSYPIGANMGIARRVIEQVGPFNTALGRTGNNMLGGEEKDLFQRIQGKGYPIYYFPAIGLQHCIPAKRTTTAYVAQLGYGIGVSERLRTQRLSTTKYLLRLLAEGIKWGGTIVLWCKYTLIGQCPKGNILVLFRKNVTQGLLRRTPMPE